MALSSDLTLLYNFPVSGPLAPTASLGPTLTFTNATSNRSYYNSAGNLVYAAANEPRPDHNPSTLAYRGKLLEDESTNQMADSEALGASGSWANTGTPVVTENNAIAPDGAMTMTTIEDNSGALEGRIKSGSGAASNNDIWTASCHMRKDSTTASTRAACLELRFAGGAATVTRVVFDTSDGSFISGVDSGGATVVNAEVVSISNAFGDFWRVILTSQNDASGNTIAQIRLYPALRTDLLSVSAVNSTQGLADFWGVQLEESPVATSYIPTSGSAVTRAADVCSTTDVSWYNQNGPGTFYIKYQLPSYDVLATTYLSTANDGTSSNYVRFAVAAAGDVFNVTIRQGGSTQYSRSGAVDVADGAVRQGALGWETNDARGYHDGISLVGDTSVVVPGGITQLNLVASEIGGAMPRVVHLQEFRYYNTRRPDTGAGSLEDLSNGLVPEVPGNKYQMII